MEDRRKFTSAENGKKGGRPKGTTQAKKVNASPSVVPELNRKAYTELARSASNLNQIARKLNAGDKVEAEAIMKELQAFRLKLLGVGL